MVKSNWIQKYLKEKDLQDIEAAVQQAEKTTRGEIVPVLVYQSVRYWHVSVILFLIILVAYFALNIKSYLEHWVEWHPVFTPLVVLGAAIGGHLLSYLGFLRQALTPSRDILRQVWLRAYAEFYHNRVGHTQERIGIMLFLSFQERMALVIADEGINQRCAAGTWESIINKMTGDLKKGKLKEGICEAIFECGKILAEHFPSQGENVNELGNQLIIKES